MNLRDHQRKAVSPVLATIILVAITLIAAVGIGGFVFGLLGTYTSVAEVKATSSTCSGTPEVCTVSLQNIGSAGAQVMGGCQMNLGGTNYQGAVTVISGSLTGGSTAVVTCIGPSGSHAIPGSQVVGSFTISNAAQVLFSALAT